MLEGRWQDRYLVHMKDFGDPEEELEKLEKLIEDAGGVGGAAVRCLERMTSDDMIEVVGMILLLMEIRGMKVVINE